MSEIDDRIANLESEHPDAYQPLEPKVIWQRHRPFHTNKCTWFDCLEGDCQHTPGWHQIPQRVRRDEYGRYCFEIMRRRKDKEPGTEWTPMTPKEAKEVRESWAQERFWQLMRKPDIEKIDA